MSGTKKKVLVVGSSVVDLTFYSDRIPLVGETVLGHFQQGLGGKGFNQAVSARLAGAETTFISAIGEDSFGSLFEARLQEIGAAGIFERVPGVATGAAAIVVDSQGRNSIIVALGANARLSPGFLDRHESSFENVGVLLLQLETNLEVIEHAVTLARRKNPECLVILNPAPAPDHLPEDLLHKLDFLTPNETELARLAGRLTVSDPELRAACLSLGGPRSLLVTLGERGAFYVHPKTGESRFFPAFSVKAIDTSGAGDAFNGALAAGLLEFGGDWVPAVRLASASAAISVTRPGTSASAALRSEIDAFLGERSR